MYNATVLFLLAIFTSIPLITSALTIHSPVIPSKTGSPCAECVTSVIVEAEPQHIHLVCSPTSKFCPSNIVNRIPNNTWTFFDNEHDQVVDFDRKDLCVMCADDVDDMLKLLGRLKMCHRANMIFAFSEMGPEMSSLKPLFDSTWKLGIIDVVAVTEVASTCHVFSYIPFKEHGTCYDTSPVLISFWENGLSCAPRNMSYFPENKISNLHSCKLVIECSEFVDNAYYGWYPLISFLMVAMNASDERLPHSHIDFPEVHDNRSDILLGKFYLSSDRLRMFVFPSMAEKIRTGIALPQKPILTFQWFRLFDELDVTVWYGVLVAMFLTVGCLYIFLRDQISFRNAVLYSAQSCLGNPCPTGSWSDPARVYFAFWLLFCLVLNATYLSTLLRKLTVDFTEDEINSIHDLQQSNLTIVSAKQFSQYSLLIMSENPDLMCLRDKVRLADKAYPSMVDRDREDNAYIIIIDDFDYLFLNSSYRIMPNVFFEASGSRILLPRPSPYERFFKASVLRIFEAGAYVCVERKALNRRLYAKSRLHVDKSATRLTLKSLGAVFGLWLVGCGVAAVAFILEYFAMSVKRFCYHSKKSKKV